MNADIYYDNQRLFCNTNNYPLFAHTYCDHTPKWMVDDDRYTKRQTLGEMLVECYGEEQAAIVSAGSHITSCPVCSKSWCD